MTRLNAVLRIAAVALASAFALATFGGSAGSTSLPGPKQPIDHLAISGANFNHRSGDPGCFTGAGSVGAGFPVPTGALITGATVYAVDTMPNANVYGELTRHDLTTGGTYYLAKGTTVGMPSGNVRLELRVDPGYVVPAGQAINMAISVGNGTCFKGAEVHFITNPDVPVNQLRVPDAAPAPELAPDGTSAPAVS